MPLTLEIKSADTLKKQEQVDYCNLITQTFALKDLSHDEIESLKKTKLLWFILKLDNNIVGLATLSNAVHDNLKNVLIIPSHRNKGLCSLLMQNITEFYLKNEDKIGSRLALTVIKNKTNTQQLLEMYKQRYSFEVYDETSEAYFLCFKNKKSCFVLAYK